MSKVNERVKSAWDIFAKNGAKIVFVAFLCCIFIQYSNVFFYHDDYAHASLSYGYVEPNVAGVRFSIPQLLDYVRGIFNQVDPRALSVIGQSIFFSSGIWPTRIVASCLVLSIFILIFLLARPEKGYRYPVLASIICVSLFGFGSLHYYRVGYYWFTALFGYGGMFFFFLLGVWMRGKCEEKFNWLKAFMLFCVFYVASFSQENTYTAVLGYCCLTVFFQIVKKHKVKVQDVWCLLGSICGILTEFFAPAMSLRFNSIASESLDVRLFARAKEIANGIFGKQGFLFSILFLLFCLLVAYLVWKRPGKIFKPISVLMVLMSIYLLTDTVICGTGPMHSRLSQVLLLILAMCTMACFVVFFWDKEKYLSLAIAGVASLVPSFISPYYVPRMLMLMYALFYVIFLHTFSMVIKDVQPYYSKCIASVLAIAVLVISASNLYCIYLGYHALSPVFSHNDAELQRASQRVEAGETVNEVHLYTSTFTQFFAGEQPWYDSHRYIESYVREYYNIPTEVPFVFEVGQYKFPQQAFDYYNHQVVE